WSPMPTLNAPIPRRSPAMAVVGSKMVFWSGEYRDVGNPEPKPEQGGGVYDFKTHSWIATSAPGAHPDTYGAWNQAVSLGNAFLIWSGKTGLEGDYILEGNIYIP